MVSIIIHGYPSIPPRAAIIPISWRNYPRYYVLPTFRRNVSSRATSFHLFFSSFRFFFFFFFVVLPVSFFQKEGDTRLGNVLGALLDSFSRKWEIMEIASQDDESQDDLIKRNYTLV